MQSSGAGSVNSLLLSISNPKLRLCHIQEGKFHEALLNTTQPISTCPEKFIIPIQTMQYQDVIIGQKVYLYWNLAF